MWIGLIHFFLAGFSSDMLLLEDEVKIWHDVFWLVAARRHLEVPPMILARLIAVAGCDSCQLPQLQVLL